MRVESMRPQPSSKRERKKERSLHIQVLPVYSCSIRLFEAGLGLSVPPVLGLLVRPSGEGSALPEKRQPARREPPGRVRIEADAEHKRLRRHEPKEELAERREPRRIAEGRPAQHHAEPFADRRLQHLCDRRGRYGEGLMVSTAATRAVLGGTPWTHQDVQPAPTIRTARL